MKYLLSGYIYIYIYIYYNIEIIYRIFHIFSHFQL
jgi:hypothetical protein